MNAVEQALMLGVDSGTAILLPSLGELIGERAGVINLGTEGCMLVGALTGYAVAAMSGNPWIGVVAGAGAGGALAALHAMLVIERKASQLASGLVMLFIGLGITSLFGGSFVSRTIHAFTPIALPGGRKACGDRLVTIEVEPYPAGRGRVATTISTAATRKAVAT